MNERAKKLYQTWNDWRAHLHSALDQLRIDELHVYEGDLRQALARVHQEIAARQGARQAFAVGDRITTSLGKSRGMPGVVEECSYDAAGHTWSYRVRTTDGATYWLRVTAERNTGAQVVPDLAVDPAAHPPLAGPTFDDEPADFFTQ